MRTIRNDVLSKALAKNVWCTHKQEQKTFKLETSDERSSLKPLKD